MLAYLRRSLATPVGVRILTFSSALAMQVEIREALMICVRKFKRPLIFDRMEAVIRLILNKIFEMRALRSTQAGNWILLR